MDALSFSLSFFSWGASNVNQMNDRFPPPSLAVSILSTEISTSICQIEFLFHIMCHTEALLCMAVYAWPHLKEFISTNIIYFLCHSHNWIALRKQSTIFVVNLCMQWWILMFQQLNILHHIPEREVMRHSLCHICRRRKNRKGTEIWVTART